MNGSGEKAYLVMSCEFHTFIHGSWRTLPVGLANIETKTFIPRQCILIPSIELKKPPWHDFLGIVIIDDSPKIDQPCDLGLVHRIASPPKQKITSDRLGLNY